MLTLGIDAGTSKWAITLLEEYKEYREYRENTKVRTKFKFETTIPTYEITKGIEGINKLLNLVENFNADCIVVPSGYGLPLKNISELTNNDLFKISLKNENEAESVGIRKFLSEAKKRKFNAYVVPSVKLLPTVENFKKVNIIDLGTSDKLCSAIYALSLSSLPLSLSSPSPLSEKFKTENFILAEIGFGFNAFLKILNGKIQDGIGGTVASSGFSSHGKLDSEINWKTSKFSGGVLSIIQKSKRKNKQEISPELFFKAHKKTGNRELAYFYFIDGIIKDISSLMTPEISKIYLCGKISVFVEAQIKEELERKFERKFTFKNIEYQKRKQGFEKIKGSSASRGGAILANGIAGGKFKDLIEWMQIKEAKGDIFDYVFV